MKKIFKDRTIREVPKCPECKSDKDVALSTYNVGNGMTEKYWECDSCHCVIRKARN